nr:MAG TPA: hypothetical protein [Caudoviricetes sp.]
MNCNQIVTACYTFNKLPFCLYICMTFSNCPCMAYISGRSVFPYFM